MIIATICQSVQAGKFLSRKVKLKEFYERMIQQCETKMRIAETVEEMEYWFKEKENYENALKGLKK